MTDEERSMFHAEANKWGSKLVEERRLSDVQRKSLERYQRALTSIEFLVREADEQSKESGVTPDVFALIDSIRDEIFKCMAPAAAREKGLL